MFASSRWLATALCLSAAAQAQTTAPRFKDFPGSTAVSTPAPKPGIADRRSRDYATHLREAARRRANFAGHYVLATWGCGASCVMAAAVEKKTARVVWLPFTVCCGDPATPPLAFRRGSRLLVVTGSRDEQGNGTYHYAFDGRGFDLVAQHEQPAR